MTSAILQTPLPDGRVQCQICQWRCELADDEPGRCRIRWQRGGTIVNDAHALVEHAAIGPIEDVRLWHLFPDAQVLCVGSFGTPIAHIEDGSAVSRHAVPTLKARVLAPERVAIVAQNQLCRGVVLTYGDPLIALEWTLDCLKLARAHSRFTAITTSGYFTPESFALIAPYLDGMRLDVYGFSERSYRELTGLDQWRAIFRIAAEARQRYNLHVEIAYQLVPGVNDSPAEIAALAKWLRVALGSLTPLHLLSDSADQETILRAITAATAVGLRFVYGPAADQATLCPSCSRVVVSRRQGVTQLAGIEHDHCAACHAALGMRTSLFRRDVRYESVSA